MAPVNVLMVCISLWEGTESIADGLYMNRLVLESTPLAGPEVVDLSLIRRYNPYPTSTNKQN